MQKLRRRTRRMKLSMRNIRKDQMPMLLLKGALIGLVGMFIMGFLVVAFFSRDLPEPGKIMRNDGFSTVFYDREGKTIYEMFEDKNRIPVTLSNIPKPLQQATIAIEDKNFYNHKGFSIPGIARSVFRIFTTGRLSGGSTLTQQLVKNVLLSQEQTITRKIKEVVLASEIERRFEKDEILEMYFNESPYGGTFWGVQSAAKGYFDKDVKELNLIESAIIAGLPQSPTVYNPISGRPGAYKNRTKSVLRRMREDNYITEKQEEQALKDLEKVKFTKMHSTIAAPHFVFHVRKLVEAKFGPKILDKGIKIKTTLDLKAQENAQDIVYDEVEGLKGLNATNGAAVVLDSQTSEILAMVGSYDYNDDEFGAFNVAADGHRQPGSSVKPFTYATAFKQGYTPSSIIMDVSTEFPNQGGESYTPVNYDGKFRGPVQYRYALANSHNIPAVKILAQVGIKNFLQTAHDMGIKSFEPTQENIKRFGLSATLGGGETTLLDLTNSFSSFAKGGQYVEPVAILEIRDHKNKVIFKAKEQKPRRVLSEEISFLISHILSDNNARAEAFGTRSFLNIPGKTVAVKTGTTNDKKDNWAIGYTNGVTVGTWVGNNNNTPMNSKIASGLTGASPIWSKIMSSLLKDYDDGIMEKPDDVVALQVDPLLGGLPKDGSPVRSEYFIKGSEPTQVSDMYKKVKVSKSDNSKLANDVEIKAGDYDEKDFIVITENDPISNDGRNRWQEGINSWVDSQADTRYKAPRDTSSSRSNELIVSIREPGDGARIDSNSVKVRVKVTSLSAMRKIEIFANDVNKKTSTGDTKDIEETIQLDNGVYTIRVRAESDKGDVKESTIKIGVNVDPNAEPPTPTTPPTPTPLIEPLLTP